MNSNKQTILEALEEAMRQEGIEVGRTEGHALGFAEGHALGFAEGYDKAMTDMSEFLKGRKPPEAPKVTASQNDPDRQRRPKGENARLVRQALSGLSKPLNPSVIRRKVEMLQGVPITYSSTRNALNQLKEEGVVAEVDGLWSLKKEEEIV